MNNVGFSESIMPEEGYVYKASIHAAAIDPLISIAKQQIKLGICTKYGMMWLIKYCEKVIAQYYLLYLNETFSRTLGFGFQ